MRKTITLGLFALIFSLFSSQVLAGNADEFCGPLKDKSSDDYIPGLYGLCTAWHNADEDAKGDLYDKFFDRAGFTVPGSGFSCYCWKDLPMENVGYMDDGLGNLVKLTLNSCSVGKTNYDSMLFAGQIFAAGDNTGDGSYGCFFSYPSGDANSYPTFEHSNLSEEEAQVCRDEMEGIALLYPDKCGPVSN